MVVVDRRGLWSRGSGLPDRNVHSVTVIKMAETRGTDRRDRCPARSMVERRGNGPFTGGEEFTVETGH